MAHSSSPSSALLVAAEKEKPSGVLRRSGRDSDRRILAAAKALFLQFGYEGVNLDRIAEMAGVSRQTLYNRFKKKEAIFLKVIESHWEALDFKGGALTSPSGERGSAETYLRAVAQRILLFVDEFEQIAFTRLVIAESRHMPWIAEEFYRLGKRPLTESFARGLEQLAARGLIVCPHPVLAAHQFLGLVQEFFIWPRVMAIGAGLDELPPARLVIEEAVATFMARYGGGAPS